MKSPVRATLILLSGNKATICDLVERKTGLPADHIVTCSEKEITRARFILDSLREGHPEATSFGCKDLDLQRYQFFLKLYLLASGAPQRLIVDESGASVRVRLFPFILVDIPKLVFEIVASLFIVFRAYTGLLRLRSSARPGGRSRS